MGTSDTAYRNAIQAGVAFLRERARHTQVPPDAAPQAPKKEPAADEPRQS
jgi:hypothetical protein